MAFQRPLYKRQKGKMKHLQFLFKVFKESWPDSCQGMINIPV